MHDFNTAQPLFEHLQFFGAASVAAVTVSAPFKEDFSEIFTVFPVSGIDEGQQSSSVTAWARTEHP